MQELAPSVDYLNPTGFALPAIGGYGNAGKGALRGLTMVNSDMGFFKNIALDERRRLQLRGEFFNIFNRVNFNDPVVNVSGAGFGSIRGAADPRIGQLAAKLIF